jgi:hypothetical protein
MDPERDRETLASIEAQIRRAGDFSKVAGRSLRRGKAGTPPAATPAKARIPRRLRCLRRLGLALLVLCLALVLVPPFTWPIRGRVSSGFFFRHSPDSTGLLDYEFHKGLDIAAPRGSLAVATAPGIVVSAGSSPTAGNYIVMRHLFGFESRYYHLEDRIASEGQLVLLPILSPLGRVGSTGRSTGPHLHFELEAGSLPLPPSALLSFHSLRLRIFGF